MTSPIVSELKQRKHNSSHSFPFCLLLSVIPPLIRTLNEDSSKKTTTKILKKMDNEGDEKGSIFKKKVITNTSLQATKALL